MINKDVIRRRITCSTVAVLVLGLLLCGCNSISDTPYNPVSDNTTPGINVDQLIEAAGITSAAQQSESSSSSEISETAGVTSESTDNTTEDTARNIVTVTFLGDITLCSEARSSNSPNGFNKVVAGDMDYCFKNCKQIFASDDLTIANLEGAVTTSEEHKSKEFVFGMPPENLQMLVNSSIEAVNLANNHTLDFLDKGYKDTKSNLESYGILWSDQYHTATYQVGDYMIGMFGICDWDNPNLAYKRIDELKLKGCNIIIATCHWGKEASYEPTSNQIYLGHCLIDHGVDIVVGGHPHRLQPIEKYKDKWIVHSISNFCFGGNTSLSDPDTVILQCKFVMDENTHNCVDYKLNIIPYSQTGRSGNDYCPVPYEWGSSRYYKVLSRLGWSQEDE